MNRVHYMRPDRPHSCCLLQKPWPDKLLEPTSDQMKIEERMSTHLPREQNIMPPFAAWAAGWQDVFEVMDLPPYVHRRI